MNDNQRELTHLDADGRVQMVNVTDKPIVRRRAVAAGLFRAQPATLDRLMSGNLPKGEALAAARIAAIMAAKRTDELIPLCHSLPLDGVEVDISRDAPDAVRIEVAVTNTGRTGVEMEALAAVSVAALTLWDMTKAIDTDLSISDVRLVSKTKTSLD